MCQLRLLQSMKSGSDPRHTRRIKIVQELFAQSFQKQKTHQTVTNAIIQNLDRIDKQIAKAAPEWPVDKIAKIDLAILRLALYELTLVKKEPAKVVIDEAVEIAKEFGGDSSPKFVNGVLGTLLRWIS